MKVREFIKNYNENSSEAISTLEIKHYVPFAEKVRLIESMQQSLVTANSEGFITYSSISKFLIFTMTAICLYTTLEIEEMTSDYDLLAEAGIIGSIVELIGADYKNFLELLNMQWADIMRDNNTIESSVNRVMGAVQISIQEAMNGIVSALFGSSGSIDASQSQEALTKIIEGVFEKTE